MIDAATTARLAGDWRAACRAANVDVHIDPADVTATFGREHAQRIEADLAGFAPDFLRLHLPYTDEDGLQPGTRVVLCRLPEPLRPRGRSPFGTPVLQVTTPPTFEAAPRLELRVVDVDDLEGGWLDLPEWSWHADAVAQRRWAYGASESRLPWHHTDGSPYGQGTVTAADAQADRAAEFERLTAATPNEQIEELYHSAGLGTRSRREPRRWMPDTVSPTQQDLWLEHQREKARADLQSSLQRGQPFLPLLAAEGHRLAHRYCRFGLQIDGELRFRSREGYRSLAVAENGTMTVSNGGFEQSWAGPSGFGVIAPLDVQLLRWGTLTPDDLHPLTHDALFPGRDQENKPMAHDPYQSVRVRCAGAWHEVDVAGASLSTPMHTDAEIRRELLLRGLGGTATGCAGAVAAFRTGRKPVPKDLRKARQALLQRVEHGDTEGLLTDLEAGFDPQLRHHSGGSLLHLLAHVDFPRVLPVLLAAGLSVHERDRDGRTPLHTAAASGAEALMAALLAEGADPAVTDRFDRTAGQVLAAYRDARRRWFRL